MLKRETGEELNQDIKETNEQYEMCGYFILDKYKINNLGQEKFLNN